MEVVNQARSRVSEAFGIEFEFSEKNIDTLESVIQEMWDTGWDPSSGDIDLFSRDFGSLLAVSIQRSLGGKFVFRSNTDLTHASIWFEQCCLEAFPFHRVFKRLTCQHGESLTYFFQSLRKALSSAVPSVPGLKKLGS